MPTKRVTQPAGKTPAKPAAKPAAKTKTATKRTSRRSGPAVELATPVVLTTDRELDEWIAGRNGTGFDPAADAYRMRLAGTPWSIVAKANGYPTANAAVTAVSRYLQKAAQAMSAQQQQEMLQMQIDRYEAVLAKWWKRMDGGDEKAAAIVLRTLERLDRVLRVTDGDVSISQETIVISADPDEYVKQLQALDAGQDVN